MEILRHWLCRQGQEKESFRKRLRTRTVVELAASSTVLVSTRRALESGQRGRRTRRRVERWSSEHGMVAEGVRLMAEGRRSGGMNWRNRRMGPLCSFWEVCVAEWGRRAGKGRRRTCRSQMMDRECLLGHKRFLGQMMGQRAARQKSIRGHQEG